MSKYFCGIITSEEKYVVSIIDESLNLIFSDVLDTDKLAELLKRKNVSIISIDEPLVMYSIQANMPDDNSGDIVNFRKRSSEALLSSMNLFTYGDRFSISKKIAITFSKLMKTLNGLGFFVNGSSKVEKSIIESYPDTTFLSCGCTYNIAAGCDEILKAKIQILRNKGVRMSSILRRSGNLSISQVDSICQAYSACMYYSGKAKSLGSVNEGYVVIPENINIPPGRAAGPTQKNISRATAQRETAKTRSQMDMGGKMEGNIVTCEYCGAQYLYTNTDGNIRINELRPIKSYNPFTEIYDAKYIKLVQVIIGTTDGLRKIKANLIPIGNNSNILKAADEESREKLSGFWGSTGDRKGYLIKFNRVDIVK